VVLQNGVEGRRGPISEDIGRPLPSVHCGAVVDRTAQLLYLRPEDFISCKQSKVTSISGAF